MKVHSWLLLLCLLLAFSGAARSDTPATTPAPAKDTAAKAPTKFNAPPDATFTVNKQKKITITTDGNPQPTITASDLTGTGLSFDSKTGILQGKPTKTGSYKVTFTAGSLPPLVLTVTVKAAATASSGPCDPITYTVRLRALQGTDADGLATALNSTFENFFALAASPRSSETSAEQDTSGTTAQPSAQKAASPHQYLCIFKRDIDEKTGKSIPLASTRAGAAVPPDQSALQNVIQKLDQPGFANVGLNQSFLVPFAYLDPSRLKILVTGLPSPAPGFVLSPADLVIFAQYRVLILHPATADLPQAWKSGTNLAAQAAKIKRDLLALEAQIAKLSGVDPRLAPLLATVASANANPVDASLFQNAELALERWDAEHTVQFAAIDPRDIALSLSELFPDHVGLQVLDKQRALEIWPPTLDQNASKRLLVNSDAIARIALYDQTKAAEAWEKQVSQDSASSPKSGSGNTNSTPTTITTSSTTITSPITVGKGASADAKTAAAKTAPPIQVQTTTSTQTTTPGSKAGEADSSASAPSSANPASVTMTSANTTTPAATDGSNSKTISAAPGAPPDKSAAASQTQTPPPLPTGTVVRLFHLRQASNIATVMNGMLPGTGNAPLVEALSDFGNDDLLLILPPVPGQQDRTASIRRMIAYLDEPRPAISLQVWSYEISSTDNTKSDDRHRLSDHARQIADAYTEFKEKIQEADINVQEALAVGLATAINRTRGGGVPFFDSDFAAYLGGKSQDCIKIDQYCLGYETALQFGPPEFPGNPNSIAFISFYRYIMLIAAASDPQAVPMIDETISKMRMLKGRIPFDNLEAALKIVVQPSNLHFFRAAVLDFLFQYKWSQEYPNDFDPYYLQRSAQTLDGYLNDLVNALNRDLDTYIEGRLENAAHCITKDAHHVGLANFGEVQVGVISGDAAAVSGAVNNYFDITQPALLKDLVAGLLNGAGASQSGGSGGPPAANSAAASAPASNAANTSGSTGATNAVASAAKLLTPWQAVALNALATASAPPQLVAQVNAQTTLAITPVSLDTAAAAELNLSLQISNPTSTIDASKGATSAFIRQDLANVVANYNVQTKVRVDSFKLFQVSSLSMDITHPQTSVPVPVVGWIYEGIFGTVPWMKDHILAVQRQPLTVQNRSVAVVRAVVVPTAMDLGLSMPFRNDHIEIPVNSISTVVASPSQFTDSFKEFHKKLIKCMLRANPAGYSCMLATRLSEVPEQTDGRVH